MEDKKQEDLDVIYILKEIKNGILSFFNSLLWLLRFSIKKSLILLPFMLIGVSLGFLMRNFQKTYYKSELNITHIRFENDYCAKMIENLNVCILDDGVNKDLAELLQVDTLVSGAVRNFTYQPFNTNQAKLYKDSASKLLPFTVEVEVYDNDMLPALQEGILNYLESNEYSSRLKDAEMKILSQIEKRVKDEIKEIDSLKQLVNQSIIPRSNGTGIILGEPIDPVKIYKRAMDSYEKLMNLNTRQDLSNSFQVVIGFNKNDVPDNGSYLRYMFMGAVFSYVFGILLLLWRNRMQKRNM